MASIDLGSVLGGTGAVLSILSMIYTAINHKRIRGRCCGKEIDIELNIDSTKEPEAAAGAKAQTPPESPILRPMSPRSRSTTPRATSAGRAKPPRKIYPEDEDVY
jgi:hypothetical protein